MGWVRPARGRAYSQCVPHHWAELVLPRLAGQDQWKHAPLERRADIDSRPETQIVGTNFIPIASCCCRNVAWGCNIYLSACSALTARLYPAEVNQFHPLAFLIDFCS